MRAAPPRATTARARSLVQTAFVLHSDGLGRKVASGARYQFAGILCRTALTIGSTAVLARLLAPADFGHVAMATVITELAGLLGGFGFASVLVQRRVITRLLLDTVFWATAAVGTILAAGIFAASFASQWLFADYQVGPLLRLLAITFLLNCLTAVPGVVIARLMRFRTEFWINLSSVLARAIVAIGCAAYGFGVWSLVVGSVASSALMLALNFTFVPYRPRLRFDSTWLTGTWRTSGSYFGNNLAFYVSGNLDLFLIGRHLGATDLGLYQTARSLTDEIRARIASPIQHVLFPAFAALQSSPDSFRELVLRAARWLAAVVVGVGVGVSANAVELVAVLYGAKWATMAPLLALFGLSAALRASTAIATPIFNAKNRVGLSLCYNAALTVGLAIVVVVALPYGIGTVTAAVAAHSLLSLLVCHAAFRLIGLGWSHLGGVLCPPAVAGAVLWLATDGLRALSWVDTAGLRLLIQALTGAAIYAVALMALSRAYRTEVVTALRTRFLR